MSRYFPVLITEHLQLTVNIEADSAVEAVTKAAEAWKHADFILDADQFTGVEISACEGSMKSILHRDKYGNEYMEGAMIK